MKRQKLQVPTCHAITAVTPPLRGDDVPDPIAIRGHWGPRDPVTRSIGSVTPGDEIRFEEAASARAFHGRNGEAEKTPEIGINRDVTPATWKEMPAACLRLPRESSRR